MSINYSHRYRVISLTVTLVELLSVIVKWGDDLRQEVLCSQLLQQFKVNISNMYQTCVLLEHDNSMCIRELAS